MQQHNRQREEQLWKLTKDYKKDYQPNVEQGLRKLKNRIAQDQEVNKIYPLRKWLARAATIAFLIIGGSILYNSLSTSSPELQLLNTQDVALTAHSLPDGSTVWLNKHSQLSYPKEFVGDKRIISLEGEAFLQVQENAAMPFVVKAGGTEIQVLGTAFNVRAYPQESTVLLEVKEGQVAFSAATTNESIRLKANEKANYQKASGQISTLSPSNLSDYTWVAEQLSFDKVPLYEIIQYLENNFQVQVSTKGNLAKCTLTTSLLDNTPDAILNRIKTTFSIQLDKRNDKQYILKGSCEG